MDENHVGLHLSKNTHNVLLCVQLLKWQKEKQDFRPVSLKNMTNMFQYSPTHVGATPKGWTNGQCRLVAAFRSIIRISKHLSGFFYSQIIDT